MSAYGSRCGKILGRHEGGGGVPADLERVEWRIKTLQELGRRLIWKTTILFWSYRFDRQSSTKFVCHPHGGDDLSPISDPRDRPPPTFVPTKILRIEHCKPCSHSERQPRESFGGEVLCKPLSVASLSACCGSHHNVRCSHPRRPLLRVQAIDSGSQIHAVTSMHKAEASARSSGSIYVLKLIRKEAAVS